jgi:radical SAM protein with 4Fe4S-binding SPASM domain
MIECLFLKGTKSNPVLYDLATGIQFSPTSDILCALEQGERIEVHKSQFNNQHLLSEKIILVPTILTNHHFLDDVHLDISYACNMSCVHCYQPTNAELLNIGTIKTLIQDLSRINVYKISISGGEPLLHPQIYEVFDLVQKYNIRLSSIFTNGTLINKIFIDYFKSFWSYSPEIMLSVDSLNKKTFETFRGNGTYEKVLKSLSLLLGNNFAVTINTMVTNINISEIESMYDIFSTLPIQRWRIGTPKYSGSYKNNRSALDPAREDLQSVYKNILSRYLEDYQKDESIFDLQVEFAFHRDMLRRKNVQLFNSDSLCCEYKKNGVCVKPNGDVTNCTFDSTYNVFGNINNDSIIDIWTEIKKGSNLKTLTVKEVSECLGCKYIKLCGTGCRINAINNGAGVEGKDPNACWKYEFFVNEIEPMLLQHGIKYIYD